MLTRTGQLVRQRLCHFRSLSKISQKLANGWPGLGVRLCLILVTLASVDRAASLTWDANGVTSPNPTDGSGTWWTANDWWNGSANVSGTWKASGPDSAIFGAGTAGTYGINLGGGDHHASHLTFNTPGYTLTNGALSILSTRTTNFQMTFKTKYKPLQLIAPCQMRWARRFAISLF